ncbi:MAG: tRNA (guanosine(37)-N1)-methyltransferase TrmD [Lachnospiraceae bacterium]
MNFHVMTLFPGMITNAMGESITGRAIKAGHINVNAVNIRDFAGNKNNNVDDYPYGGGAGMVIQAEPVYLCYRHICENIQKRKQCQETTGISGSIYKNIEVTPGVRVIYLTPQGKTFNQELACEYATEEDLVFLCGHYEGIDERVTEEIVTDYVSIGDYVLTGGELPALVMMDAISRFVPGVLNNCISARTESFSGNLLEYPQYTRPAAWRGKEVPPILLSGNHKKLAEWYRKQSVIRTALMRPDLLEGAELTEEEKELAGKVAGYGK